MFEVDTNLTAGERAYQWTKEAILSGRFPEGSFLEEKVVCDEAAVSRTPVREGFHRLSAEKFIDLLPRRGAQVRRVAASELTETYDMRVVLESRGFEIVCGKNLPVPDLGSLLDTMEEPDRIAGCQAGDRQAITEHAKMDFTFHFSLIQASGHGVLTDLFATLQPRHQRIGVSAVSLRPRRLTVIGPQHRAILKSLRAHDYDTAAATLREHLRPDESIMSSLG